MTKLTVLGWYNQRNVGDEAFKDALQLAASASGRRIELQFVTERLPPVDRLILGGGDVIRDFYLGRIPTDVAIYPIGVGLGYATEVALLADRRVPAAFFRNRSDVEIAKSAGLNAEYCPDMTFILDNEAPFDIALEAPKRLGVLLTDEVNPTWETRDNQSYLYYEYFKWELARILDYLSEFYSIYFIPFSRLDSIDDSRIHHDVFRRMKMRSKVTLLERDLSASEALWLIGQLDLVITMKLHGMLFAVNRSVPFLNIGETRKTELFCHEQGFARLSVPRYSLEYNRFLEFVKEAESPETRGLIESVSARLKQECRELLPEAVRRCLDGSR